MKKPTISPSALDMYLRCGEQYRRAYILKDKQPPGVAMIKGGSVHKAAEVNFRQKIVSHEDLNVADLQEVAAAHVDTTIAGEGLMLSPDEESRGMAKVKGELVDRAVVLTGVFRREVAPTVQPVLVEEFVRIELPRHTHDLNGRLDVVDDGNRVRDIKTSGRRKSQDDVDRSDQLTYYAAAASRKMGKPITDVVLDVLVDTKTPAVQRLTSTRTDADKRVFLAKLTTVMDAINKGVFPPAPVGSWWCSYKFCGYAGSCPFFNSERRSAAEENDR